MGYGNRRKLELWELGFIGLVGFLGLMFVAAFVYGGVESYTSERCAHYGFPDSGVTWDFDRYCLTEVNETDYVVPLGDAETWSPPRHYQEVDDG